MEFEYDPEKSAANLLKHGIDFESAKGLWDDVRRIEIQARSDTEARFVSVGRIGSAHWSCIFTYRGERVRIISVRRSRRQEIEDYEG